MECGITISWKICFVSMLAEYCHQVIHEETCIMGDLSSLLSLMDVHRIWTMHFSVFYPHPTILWVYTGFNLTGRPCSHLPICWWHGFWSITCFGISIWNFTCTFPMSHRENSPITQTTPEPTLLSWGGWPREKISPHPWPHGKPGLIALIGPLRPYCSQALWSCSGVSWK